MLLLGLLHCSIRQSMWDAILEYRMLSAPLAVKDVQEDLQEAMKEETGKVSEDAAASAGGSPLSAHEAGTRGQLHPMYQDTVFRWLDLGLRIESAAVATHKVELVATNSIPFVLRELQAQVSCDWSAAGPSAHFHWSRCPPSSRTSCPACSSVSGAAGGTWRCPARSCRRWRGRRSSSSSAGTWSSGGQGPGQRQSTPAWSGTG